jgi:hypothetical protein
LQESSVPEADFNPSKDWECEACTRLIGANTCEKCGTRQRKKGIAPQPSFPLMITKTKMKTNENKIENEKENEKENKKENEKENKTENETENENKTENETENEPENYN